MIEVGDHVTVGKGKVHWIVEYLHLEATTPHAHLRSGMSDIHRNAPVIDLQLFAKGKAVGRA